MVDQTDINKVSTLNAELQMITIALDIFGHGGRITSLTVASAEGDPEARSLPVNTAGMSYPPQMLDAIGGFLATRQRQIGDELTTMGITGIQEPQPRKEIRT